MKRLLYIGSSWAVRSFDKDYENPPKATDVVGQDYTNLAYELGLDVVDLSQFNLSNLSCLNLIRQYNQDYDAVVWVYCEPIKDIEYNQYSTIEEFLTKDNFWQLRTHTNTVILEQLSMLGKPIALIGGASDVDYVNHPNLTVIHPSWQKFLAQHAGLNLEHGWSADVAHHDITRFPKIKPSAGLVDLISNTFDVWDKLATNNLFAKTHPNTAATKLFASHIKPGLNTWLDNL